MENPFSNSPDVLPRKKNDILTNSSFGNAKPKEAKGFFNFIKQVKAKENQEKDNLSELSSCSKYSLKTEESTESMKRGGLRLPVRPILSDLEDDNGSLVVEPDNKVPLEERDKDEDLFPK